MNDLIVYTYRYMWRMKDGEKDKYNVKILSGLEKEHNAFMASLRENEDVKVATRVYVSEINVAYVDQHEIVKEEKK